MFSSKKKLLSIADVFKAFGKKVDGNHYQKAHKQYRTLSDHARYLAKSDKQTVKSIIALQWLNILSIVACSFNFFQCQINILNTLGVLKNNCINVTCTSTTPLSHTMRKMNKFTQHASVTIRNKYVFLCTTSCVAPEPCLTWQTSGRHMCSWWKSITDNGQFFGKM